MLRSSNDLGGDGGVTIGLAGIEGSDRSSEGNREGMSMKSGRVMWILAHSTIVCIVGLLPVLQFLEANPYFKFRYGFDESLLALVVAVFLGVPLIVTIALGWTTSERTRDRRLVWTLSLALLFFTSQLYSTSLHTAPLAARLAAVAGCLVVGGVAVARRRRQLAWSLAAVSLLVVPYTAFQVVRHWWWIPKPPHAPSMKDSGLQPGQHDLFVFFLDGCTLTSDWLDADHLPDPSLFPNLHRFVARDAVWFYNAVSSGPETMLSMPCMFTGQLYMSRANQYLSKEPTIFSILKPRYNVRAWLHTRSAFCSGEDFERCYPFTEQDLVEPMRVLVESWAYISTFRLTKMSYAIGKLDEATYHREPLVADFLSRVADPGERPAFFTIQLFDRGVDGMKDFDVFFGRFVQILKESGRYDDSIIAIVSDHGLNVDAEGHMTYGRKAEQTMHLYRVPFAVKPPGAGQGRVDPYPAQGIDIAPTLLALVLPADERASLRFDGVDVLASQPVREHWINLREPGFVYRFKDPTGREPGLEAVPVQDTGLLGASPP